MRPAATTSRHSTKSSNRAPDTTSRPVASVLLHPFQLGMTGSVAIRLALALSLLTLASAKGSSAFAGVSAENVIVVVNGQSIDSKTIANYYIQLRNIPSCNVLVLDDVPSGLTCKLDDFLARILRPVLNHLDAAGLAAQTSVIAYSAGFPTTVDVSPHTKRITHAKLRKIQNSSASLTGATYFYAYLLADSEHYLGLGANFYARGPLSRSFANPFLDGPQRDQFAAAVSLGKEEDSEKTKHEEAGRAFEALFDQTSTQSPLAILAARSYAKAGSNSQASRLLKLALQSGWQSLRYLQSIDEFEPLLESEELADAIDKLPKTPRSFQHAVGFSSQTTWSVNGWPMPQGSKQGIRYLMSCMLAVTHPRGNTTEEAIAILKRSSSCDRTFPSGWFWFTKTSDVRSTTRIAAVPDAMEYLDQLGKKTGVVRSSTPKASEPVTGLMLGTPNIPLDNRSWEFSPGAITDNLTSLGAAFGTASQTKLTELLSAGAVMSCGAVAEPYAIAEKFPVPMMYGFYAGGTSAIEAYYLSIASPYQTLIVGDPIAAPYRSAIADQVRLARDTASQRIQLRRQQAMVIIENDQVAAMVLFVNGKRLSRLKDSPSTTLSLAGAPVGEVGITLALISKGAKQTQTNHRFTIDRNPATQALTETSQSDTRLEAPQVTIVQQDSESITLSIQKGDATEVQLHHLGRSIADIENDEESIRLPRAKIGNGPVRLQIVANLGGNAFFGTNVVVKE